MGLTCTSLHMFSPGLSSATAGPGVGDTVGQALEGLDYARIESAEEADRQLIAVVAGPWISFFDLNDPGAVTKASVDLGKRLSAVSHCPVILTAVVDSDALALVVFEEGKQVDAYASARGILPAKVKKWPVERRAEQWSRLFGRAIGQADLEAFAGTKAIFAEDLLRLLCGLMGLPYALAVSTPDDLQVRPWPHQQAFCFRAQHAPGAMPITQTGACLAPTSTVEIPWRGEHSFPFELNGPAGAFRDPILEFSGSAVEQGLVALSDRDYGNYGLWALGIKAIRARQIHTVHADLSAAELDGRRVLRTCLKGLSAEQFTFAPQKQSILIYWCCLRGQAVGSGDVQVRLIANSSANMQLPLRPGLHFQVGAA